MAIHKVVYTPAPCLAKVSRDLRPEEFDEALDQLIADMFETMRDYDGVGLAAPQIGINIRLSVIDTREATNNQHVLINPHIISKGTIELKDEGCLSVPGQYDKVPRANDITVRLTDRAGNVEEKHVTGFLAHAMQHEIDHLDGKLFIDYLSPLKRQRIRTKMKKLQRLPNKKS